MMRRRLSSCFRAQKENKTAPRQLDESRQKDDVYIQVNVNTVTDEPLPVKAEDIVTPTAAPELESSSLTTQQITDTEREQVASDSGQEQQEEGDPSTSNSTPEDQEDDAPEVDKEGSSTQQADPGTDEDSDGIEPEWTILDADDLTGADYPEFVKLRNSKRISKASSRKFDISGSWELLYNMAAAEIEQPMEVGQEPAVEGADHKDEEEQVHEALRESEEDELEPAQSSTLEDPGSAKKKKFKPWKSIRNFFKKKRPGKEEEELNRPVSEEEGIEGDEVASPGLLSPSLAKGISVSEDSVFSPDKPAPTKEEVRTSAEMNIPSGFANELTAKLKRRSGIEDDVQRTAEEPVASRVPEHKPVPPKPAARSSEKRKSDGISMDDELSSRQQRQPPATKARRWKSFTAASHEERKQQEQGKIHFIAPEDIQFDDFNLDLITSTGLLENTAARHRISVAPRARRTTTRPGHRPSKRPVTTHEVPPKPTETPSELLQSEPTPKRPKSTPVTTCPYPKPSASPPPLPTTPIPSKRASVTKATEVKSSTTPPFNAIPPTKQPPPVKLPRPPSLGPMVLPPIAPGQALRGGLRTAPPRSKSLGEAPSEGILSPEHNGSDNEPKSLELTKSFDETEALKGKKSPTSPLSPISPVTLKAKPVTRKDSKEPMHKFIYAKKDEAKQREKDEDTKKELVSPVKEPEPPKEVTSPVGVSSPKEVSPKEPVSPKEMPSPKQATSPKAVASPIRSKSPTTEEPMPVSVGSPKEVASPKAEAASKAETVPVREIFPEVVSASKEEVSTPVEEVLTENVGASIPKETVTPKEILSPKEIGSPNDIGSPNEISSPKQESVAKELFPSEKNQDEKDEQPAPAMPLPMHELSSPTESKTEEKVIASKTDKEETVPPPTQQKPSESELSEKPSTTVKVRAEKPAAPRRGNVRANMALFEPTAVTPAKPAVSDSSSAPRAMKRWSLAGSKQPSFEEGAPAVAKPEEKAVNSMQQDPEPKKPSHKKPVSPPKPRKAPVNTQETPDSQGGESPDAKPLSFKERMSKFQGKSNVTVAPKPWKTRTTSTSSKEDSNKQKEANQPVPSEKQDIIQVADKNKSEPSPSKPADDSQNGSPVVDSSQGEKSNENPPSNQSCENSSPDKKDSTSPSTSSNETTPNNNTTPMKENVDQTTGDKSTPTSTSTPARVSPAKPSPKKRGFVPKIERCIACQQPVYLTEMAKAEGKTFHKGCQKCTECHRTLMIGNLQLVDGNIYCKLHGTQMKNKLLKLRLEIE